MRIKSGLLFLSAIVALSAQLPDFKPTSPIHEVQTSVFDSTEDSYRTFRIERYSYTDENYVSNVKKYLISKAGDEDLLLAQHYVYDGEKLDSILDSKGGKTNFIYGKDSNYMGITSYNSSNSGQSGHTETDKVLSYNALGNVREKLMVKSNWGRYTASTDSLFSHISYNEAGNPASELTRVSEKTSKTGGAGTGRTYFTKTVYRYDGDLLFRKTVQRCEDESLTDSSQFVETGYTTYMQLTGLSGEDVSVEESYSIIDDTHKLLSRTTVSRNEQGLITDSLTEKYVDSLDMVIEKSKYRFVYSDATGLLKEILYTEHNGNSVETYKKEYFYNNETTVSNTLVNAPSELKVLSKNSTLTFTLSSAGAVSLNVYSVDGRKVMTLFDGRNLEKGNYTLDLKPIAQFRGVASGVYIYQFSALGKQFSGKVAIQ